MGRRPPAWSTVCRSTTESGAWLGGSSLTSPGGSTFSGSTPTKPSPDVQKGEAEQVMRKGRRPVTFLRYLQPFALKQWVGPDTQARIARLDESVGWLKSGVQKPVAE